MQSVNPPEFRLLVTGGAGFIGSNFVLHWLAEEQGSIVNLDKLTYAGNLGNLAQVKDDPRHKFVHGSINDRDLLAKLFSEHRPTAVVHVAAESHVDRSIHAPQEFVLTNVNGTLELLNGALAYWGSLENEERARFRFLHVSTDEVYGSLHPGDPAFTETAPYSPNSPYAASKAASDHLVRAYHHTYGLPTLTTNCSNNYGPHQFPEKLVPLVVLNAAAGKPLPLYGDGKNVRDWLYVRDHCRAIAMVLKQGQPGETYNVGGLSEKNNLQVVHRICAVLDELRPAGKPHERLIQFVPDRPGHDRRCAIDCGRIQRELGWRPMENFDTGLRRTVEWYLENDAWVRQVTSGEHRKWMELNYENRCAACGA